MPLPRDAHNATALASTCGGAPAARWAGAWITHTMLCKHSLYERRVLGGGRSAACVCNSQPPGESTAHPMQAVAYCSRECQAKHWKEGRHKAECSRLAAQRGG